jgi:hypothetical protein
MVVLYLRKLNKSSKVSNFPLYTIFNSIFLVKKKN